MYAWDEHGIDHEWIHNSPMAAIGNIGFSTALLDYMYCGVYITWNVD